MLSSLGLLASIEHGYDQFGQIAINIPLHQPICTQTHPILGRFSVKHYQLSQSASSANMQAESIQGGNTKYCEF